MRELLNLIKFKSLDIKSNRSLRAGINQEEIGINGKIIIFISRHSLEVKIYTNINFVINSIKAFPVIIRRQKERFL